MNVKEVAVTLGVSQDTVRREIQRCKLECSRVGSRIYISPDDLGRYLASTKNPVDRDEDWEGGRS